MICLLSCLRYCKSTIFQANHNRNTTYEPSDVLFAILQKYDFSSKSQLLSFVLSSFQSCLRYCKSTIFQANHNLQLTNFTRHYVVCDTAKVRFFKQITTVLPLFPRQKSCLRYCKSTIFQANHNVGCTLVACGVVVCDTAKVRFFKQITTRNARV